MKKLKITFEEVPLNKKQTHKAAIIFMVVKKIYHSNEPKLRVIPLVKKCKPRKLTK